MVLFPFVVQASHALDNHEHKVCTAKDVKHFHAEELDCCLCCPPIKLNTLLFSYTDSTFKPIKYSNNFKVILQLLPLEFFKFKSTRAPPSFS